MNREQNEEYLLGTGDDEFVRLGFQHRVWAKQAFAHWERAGFGTGQTILDLGSGPGYATLDLVRLVGPTGRAIAVDSSERFIRQLEAQVAAAGVRNVEARVADVSALDLESGSLDGVYARWLFCFVRDPNSVMKCVARALRPGGVLAIYDYYNYTAFAMSPSSDIFEKVIAAVPESWKRRGGDLDVGRKLPRMMIDAGLKVRDVRPVVRAARPSDSLWQWPATFFRGFLPTLVEMKLITESDRDAFLTEWQTRERDPASFLTTPPMLEFVATRPA